MSEQDREARDLELRYQQSLQTIRAGQDPAPRARRDLVIEVESSTWSTADISTDSPSEERPINAPAQRAASSDSESDSPQAVVPRAKAIGRGVFLPQPKPKPKLQARAKQRAGPRAKQLPRALDRLALLRRIGQQRRLVQAAEREARRAARVQRVEDRREREQRRRRGLPTRSTN